jgi:transcription initiation factor TFIIIB Brf1 subunit/transcription initiation factor TFIIB
LCYGAVAVKCPHCGGNPVVYDPEFGEYVCTHCGTVVSDHPVVDDDEYRENPEDRDHVGTWTFQVHNMGVGFTAPVSARDEKIKLEERTPLRTALTILRRRFHGVFFTDKCTLEDAGLIVHEVLGERRYASKRILERLVRVAVILASRRCNSNVDEAEVAGGRNRIVKLMNWAFKKFPAIRAYYVKPNTMEKLRGNIAKVVLCLEKEGRIPSETSGEVVRESVEIAEKILPWIRDPQIAAGALVHAVTWEHNILTTYKEIAKCLGKSPATLENSEGTRRIRKHILRQLRERRES